MCSLGAGTAVFDAFAFFMTFGSAAMWCYASSCRPQPAPDPTALMRAFSLTLPHEVGAEDDDGSCKAVYDPADDNGTITVTLKKVT